jgi:hypothetical protein
MNAGGYCAHLQDEVQRRFAKRDAEILRIKAAHDDLVVKRRRLSEGFVALFNAALCAAEIIGRLPVGDNETTLTRLHQAEGFLLKAIERCRGRSDGIPFDLAVPPAGVAEGGAEPSAVAPPPPPPAPPLDDYESIAPRPPYPGEPR